MVYSLTCLLIDDDPDDREIFGIALQTVDDKSRYLSFQSGIDALDQIENDSGVVPQYIFIDLNMAMMGGRECYKELKKLSHFSKSKFIFYSTSSFEKDINETRKMGSDHFITKPNRISDLVKILQHLLIQDPKVYYLNDILKN